MPSPMVMLTRLLRMMIHKVGHCLVRKAGNNAQEILGDTSVFRMSAGYKMLTVTEILFEYKQYKL